MISHLLKSINRRWRNRKSFAAAGDWARTLADMAARFAKKRGLPIPPRQIAVRVRGVPHPLWLRLGTADGFVLEEIFVDGVYDAAGQHVPSSAGLIVDLGANIGLSVRYWLERFPNAYIVAAEPHGGNFQQLERNIAAAGGASRVTAVAVCVAGSARRVTLGSVTGDECAFEMADAKEGAREGGDDTIPAVTLPELLGDLDPDRPIDLLKCDIEGAEREVFATCRGWIQRVRYLFIELHPPYEPSDLHAALAENGVEVTVLHEASTAGNPVLLLRLHPGVEHAGVKRPLDQTGKFLEDIPHRE